MFDRSSIGFPGSLCSGYENVVSAKKHSALPEVTIFMFAYSISVNCSIHWRMFDRYSIDVRSTFREVCVPATKTL